MIEKQGTMEYRERGSHARGVYLTQIKCVYNIINYIYYSNKTVLFPLRCTSNFYHNFFNNQKLRLRYMVTA